MPRMTPSALLATLDAIEAELKRLGWWTDTAPPMPEGDEFPAFGEGLMAFPQWLQWIFLPNARAACADLDLPSGSQVGVKAVREFDGEPDADRLIELLSEFDDQVALANRQRRRRASGQT